MCTNLTSTLQHFCQLQEELLVLFPSLLLSLFFFPFPFPFGLKGKPISFLLVFHKWLQGVINFLSTSCCVVFLFFCAGCLSLASKTINSMVKITCKYLQSIYKITSIWKLTKGQTAFKCELCDRGWFLQDKAVKQGDENVPTSRTQALKTSRNRKKKKRELKNIHICWARQGRKILTHWIELIQH